MKHYTPPPDVENAKVEIESVHTIASGTNVLGTFATIAVRFKPPQRMLFAATIAAARNEAIAAGRAAVGDDVAQEITSALSMHDDFWQMNLKIQGFSAGGVRSEQVRSAAVAIGESARAAGKTRRIELE